MTDRLGIALTVNGERIRAEVPPRLALIDFLRDDLGLTGAHLGCAQGVCGACTIRIDGRAVRSCLVLAVQADGSMIETVEGLSDDGRLTDLQEAFHRHNALQCGYCTPGMLITALELLESGDAPAREDIREALSGNYCRCTGYQSIMDAVEEVAHAGAGSERA